MRILTKSGNSKGAKRGWETRRRGGSAPAPDFITTGDAQAAGMWPSAVGAFADEPLHDPEPDFVTTGDALAAGMWPSGGNNPPDSDVQAGDEIASEHFGTPALDETFQLRNTLPEGWQAGKIEGSPTVSIGGDYDNSGIYAGGISLDLFHGGDKYQVAFDGEAIEKPWYVAREISEPWGKSMDPIHPEGAESAAEAFNWLKGYTSARKSTTARQGVYLALKNAKYDEGKHHRDAHGRFASEPDFGGGADQLHAGNYPSGGHERPARLEPTEHEITQQQARTSSFWEAGWEDKGYAPPFDPKLREKLDTSPFEETAARFLVGQDDPTPFDIYFDEFAEERIQNPPFAGDLYEPPDSGLELYGGGRGVQADNEDLRDKLPEAFNDAFGSDYSAKDILGTFEKTAGSYAGYTDRGEDAGWVIPQDAFNAENYIKTWRKLREK